MSITVADCMKLPSLRMGKVVAGKGGLNRIVNTVSVLEIVDKAIFEMGTSISNGGMTLTSFYTIKDDPEEQCRYLEYMSNIGDTCIVLYYVGIFVKELHPSVLEVADRLNLPLIVMPENRKDFLYSEVIGEVYESIFRNRLGNNDFIDNVTTLITQLPENMRTVSTLLQVISSQLKITLVLSDISLRNVYLSKWPPSNEITTDTICQLYENASTVDEYWADTIYEDMPVRVFCMPFTTFEYRNFSMYALDEFQHLTMDDMFKVIEVLQIFSKLWSLDSTNILQNALVPAIIEGDEKKMRSLAAKLNIDVDSINTSIIIRPNLSGKSTKEQLHIKRDMINATKTCSQHMGKNTIVDAHGLYIICFTMYSSSKASDNEYIDELVTCLDQVSPDYTIAFFPNENKAEDVQKTYLLYSEYVTSVLDIFPQKKELSYGDILFAKRCMQMISEKDEDYRICYNILKPLIESSDSKDLLTTLAVYHLDTECEVKKTAELLFFHRNTVKYRLNKISEITNFKSADILHSYLMHTAIACHRLSKRVK